jgi:hypothetical protein
MSLKEVTDLVMNDIQNKGLDVLSDKISGHFAWFRVFELAFSFNRLRGFIAEQR